MATMAVITSTVYLHNNPETSYTLQIM